MVCLPVGCGEVVYMVVFRSEPDKALITDFIAKVLYGFIAVV